MTTIGFDIASGMLAADSRSSNGWNGSFTDNKNKVVLLNKSQWVPWVRLANGQITERITAFAGTGTVATIDMLIRLAIEQGEDMVNALTNLPDSDYLSDRISATLIVFTNLAAHTVKLVTRAERKSRGCIRVSRIRNNDGCLFWGSGSSHARTMTQMKLGMVHGLVAARMLDKSTGGPINVYSREEDGFFMALDAIPDRGQQFDFEALRKALNKLEITQFTKKHDRLHHSSDVNHALERRSKECKPRIRYDWGTGQFNKVPTK